MPTPSTPPHTTPSRRTLRRWLVSRKASDKAALRIWLETTPPQDAAAQLALIAKDAGNYENRLWAVATKVPLVFFFGYVLFLQLCFSGAFYLHPAFFVLGALLVSVLFDAWHVRGANAAALLWGQTGDVRAVACLTRQWTPRPLTVRDGIFNTEVARELTRMLSERQGLCYDEWTEAALRQLIARAFPMRFGERLSRHVHPTPDLSEGDADLVLAIVRHLGHQFPRHTKARTFSIDTLTLSKITRSPLPGAHRTLVRNVASDLIIQNARRGKP